LRVRTPLVHDRRRFEIAPDELHGRLASAIGKAFAKPPEEVEPGVWRTTATSQGIAQDITVRLEDLGASSELLVEVSAHRRPETIALLASTTLAAIIAWLAAAALTFSDFRGPQDTTRILAWLVSLAASMGLTAYLIHLAKTRRVQATSALTPIDQLWRALEDLESAPRVGRGYRIAPEIASEAQTNAIAEAEAQARRADAQAEQEAEQAADEVIRRQRRS
jgi:hypothetical protein